MHVSVQMPNTDMKLFINSTFHCTDPENWPDNGWESGDSADGHAAFGGHGG